MSSQRRSNNNNNNTLFGAALFASRSGRITSSSGTRRSTAASPSCMCRPSTSGCPTSCCTTSKGSSRALVARQGRGRHRGPTCMPSPGACRARAAAARAWRGAAWRDETRSTDPVGRDKASPCFMTCDLAIFPLIRELRSFDDSLLRGRFGRGLRRTAQDSAGASFRLAPRSHAPATRVPEAGSRDTSRPYRPSRACLCARGRVCVSGRFSCQCVCVGMRMPLCECARTCVGAHWGPDLARLQAPRVHPG